MRHAVRGRKLGRTSSHREAMFRNQLQSLLEKERIVTTLPKAKELRPIAERVITRGKQDTVPARRWVLRWVLNRDLVKKVFDDIAPRFVARPGGYLRIVKLGPRKGDGAEMAILEMVEKGAGAAADAAKPAKEKVKKPAPKRRGKPEDKAAMDESKAAHKRGGGGGQRAGHKKGKSTPTRQKTV